MHKTNLTKYSMNQLSQELGMQLLKYNWVCAVAESCTGGGVAAAITEISGSSSWFDRGFVTYSNLSKQEMLDVPEQVITTYGVVSEQTVCAMAKGALHASNAQLSVAVSGIAGPGGGSVEKPVGTVWLAWSHVKGATKSQCYYFSGNRKEIRKQCIRAAIEGLIRFCEQLQKES